MLLSYLIMTVVFIYRAKTAEIPLKECSAYGQVDQGGAEREEPHIYELP